MIACLKRIYDLCSINWILVVISSLISVQYRINFRIYSFFFFCFREQLANSEQINVNVQQNWTCCQCLLLTIDILQQKTHLFLHWQWHSKWTIWFFRFVIVMNGISSILRIFSLNTKQKTIYNRDCVNCVVWFHLIRSLSFSSKAPSKLLTITYFSNNFCWLLSMPVINVYICTKFSAICFTFYWMLPTQRTDMG